MRSNGQDQPSETERLRVRVNRLEMRLERLKGDAPSDRTTAAAFIGGTVALFLSLSLPWIREGGGFRVFDDAVDALEPTGYATGWDVLWGALDEGHGFFFLTLVLLLVQIGFAVGCQVKQNGFRLVTLMVLCALVPALSFVSWFWTGVPEEDVAAASGVFVMLTASAVLGWAAYRSWHEDHVVSRPSRHS